MKKYLEIPENREKKGVDKYQQVVEEEEEANMEDLMGKSSMQFHVLTSLLDDERGKS